MEPLKGNQLMELAFPKMSYQNLLESQKDVIQNQIENLLEVVEFQCKLTGVNPLSQEMAAGALSIKIGKKPRDLLNPKAVKYMQFVFSIKDAISKRETREISARFGVTVTQVRDFFAGQRSRVRKFVRMSREKTDKSAASDARPYEMASTSDPNLPAEPVPLDTVAPIQVEEGPSCSTRHEVSPGMEESDIYFTENIFRLMRKEESFAGQVKLLQWILLMENPSVTTWFLNEGGVILLATWLSEAATEEQTSVLRLILDVLCHLPLKKASSVHMSAVLQSVNRLRFYRTPDVANRSTILIAQWTKLFQKIQASKKSKSAGEAQDEMLLKQSIQEVMGNESLELRDDNSREAQRLLCENPNYLRKLDTAPPLKLLTASGDDSHKRRGVLSSHTRERRKVQMVEQPGQRLAVRNPQAAKSTPTTQSRPLSADDIQKAKMRAQFMQSKHGKAIAGSDVQVKPESQNIGTSSQASVSPSVSKSHVRPQIEELRKADKALPEVANPKETIDLEEPPWKKYKRIQIPWRAPPEVKIVDEWSVGTGANSKEVEIQRNRIRRERETIYRSIQEIPSNPREPWDHEMDYDDTLTPKIPIEQLPDVEPLETPTNSDNHSNQQFAAIASTSSSSMPEPDLELLAELLKNPDLVFALAPKEGGDLSSHDTVKMLDMIKTYGVDGLSNLAGLKQHEDSKVEVSLPSPTPSNDIVANGQKPDFSRNPFSRQHAMQNGNAYRTPEVALSIGSPASTSAARQPSPAVQHWAPHAVVQSVASQQTSIQLPDHWHAPSNQLTHHQNHNSLNSQNLTPEFMINANNVVNFSRAPSNIISAASPTIWTDPLSNVKQSPLGRTYAPPQLAPQYPYSQEPIVSNTFRGRQSYEPNYQYQNNSTLNDYNGYARGPVQGAVPVGNRDGRTRNNMTEGPGFESWSPDNSPSRRHEYYQEPGVNFRQGYGPEWGSDPQLSGYRDNGSGGAGNKRWRDQRR